MGYTPYTPDAWVGGYYNPELEEWEDKKRVVSEDLHMAMKYADSDFVLVVANDMLLSVLVVDESIEAMVNSN